MKFHKRSIGRDEESVGNGGGCRQRTDSSSSGLGGKKGRKMG